ncbi:hypothetical protein CIHG_05812 [Coccidioides immitis H538.4]|uniref:Major facilitator superfamily (MFS) profile domain-containing protein n=1 Tax=Coccidioides immitis H538.4 TaxID=396776 RepID=A0A0J8RS32_COCIT|nr:hypothetical protein CIHG_05812 [Coccidioides immitis H538.4]
MATSPANASKESISVERYILSGPQTTGVQAQAVEFRLTARAWLAFVTLAVLTLMVALDGTSISVALPIIAFKLHGTALEAFWSGTSFLLCSTGMERLLTRFVRVLTPACEVFQPTFTSFSNIFGRKPMVIASILFFLAGALIAGLGNSFTLMLLGRSVQGVGGGGIIALCEVVVTDLVPMRLRGQYFGILSTMCSLGSVLGPIVGGGFAQNFCADVLRLNFVPSSLVSKLRRIDYLGITLFTASATSFLIPVTWGGIMYAWNSWRTLVPLILGALGLIGAMYYEAYIPANPAIPISIFATRTAVVTYTETVLHGLVLWCGLYFMPLYFETMKEYTPILTAFAIQASATEKNMAIAVGMFSFFRAFGQAIGVAIGGAIFQNQMFRNIRKYPELAERAAEFSKDAAALVQVIREMDDGRMKLDLKQAYTDSLRIVWAVCCGIIGAGGLLSLLTKAYDLNRGIESEQTLKERKPARLRDNEDAVP